MKNLRFAFGVVALGLASSLCAGEASPANGLIDLPTVLRLAGANNLDVQIAREKLAEARAANDSARARYFPWVAPAITYRRHENNIQTVEGRIIDADKQSLAIGVGLTAQLDLGEVYYQNLVARQGVRSGEAALAARQRELTYRAAAVYFDLARARSAVGAADEALRLARQHAEQIGVTTEAGITFVGDAARVRAARERSELTLSRLRAEQRIAAARLAELLRLDPAVELTPVETDLAPLALVTVEDSAGPLVARAMASRPELDESAARVAAARASRQAATRGPLIPTVGAQINYGGLGGGQGSRSPGGSFDVSEDYSLGVSWRVGPGGLFDRNREREMASRERLVELELEKTRDAIRRQVVEQHTRVRALKEQIALSQRALEASDQTARLSRQRRETGVSAVLEDVQAEDDLARARRDYFATVADYNQAQYALRFAVGD
ncbi:MAG TPA: TolC family protein [Opitutaceae bacterium]|nr:TolC family protein [Opitutaceae bacterium]